MNTNIFRDRDVRGKYPEEINEDIFDKIGNAFAQCIKRDIIVACDARNESTSLMNAFMDGATKAEKGVTNIGMAPQACAINWAIMQQKELAYITGSHLPKGQNGIKFFHTTGLIYHSSDMKQVYDAVVSGKYFYGIRAAPVKKEIQDILDIYVRNLASKIKSESNRRIKILIDCGNGVNGMIAREVFSKAGFDVDVIFENPDGDFPNRGADPRTDPLTELKKCVKKYDFGIAYDADGDRFFVVSNRGTMLTTEQILHVLLLKLKGYPGDVVTNVECGRAFDMVAEMHGRKVIRVKVGTYPMEEGVINNSAVAGIESSHHCFVPSVSTFSDAIAVSMLFSKSVDDSEKQLNDIVKDVPIYPLIRKDYVCQDSKKFEIIKNIEKKMTEKYNNINTIDGIRVEIDNGWALIRPSQTEGMIRLSVEADDEETLKCVEQEFSTIIEREISQAY